MSEKKHLSTQQQLLYIRIITEILKITHWWEAQGSEHVGY